MALHDIRISRRAVLAAGGSLGALAALAPAALFAATAAPAADPAGEAALIRYVLSDARHPHTLAHARTLDAAAERLDVGEGLTRLWQDRLLPLWREKGGAVAGVTTRAVWECLAEQARSHALRTRALTPLGDNDGHPDNLVTWIIA